MNNQPLPIPTIVNKASERYPHLSRAAITEYLLDHDTYHPMNSWNGGTVLSWNVKMHGVWDDRVELGLHADPSEVADLDRSLDDLWKKHMQEAENFFYDICENMAFVFNHGWTAWDGKTEATFFFNGRSGGHMCLDTVDGFGAGRWRSVGLCWDSMGHFEEWLAELEWQDLQKFYRMVRDVDLQAEQSMLIYRYGCEVNFLRQEWEAEHKASLRVADVRVVLQSDDDFTYEKLNELERWLAGRPNLYGFNIARVDVKRGDA